MKRRANWYFAALVGLVLVAGLIVAFAYTRWDHPLPQGARLLEKQRPGVRHPRVWLDNDRYVSLRWLKQGIKGVPRNGYYPFVRNVRADSDVLTGLEASAENSALILAMSRAPLSPDGQYRLTLDDIHKRLVIGVRRNSEGFPRLSSVDVGAGYADVTYGPPSIAWARSGQAWSVLHYDRQVWRLQTYPVRGVRALQDMDVSFLAKRQHDQLQLYGFTKRGLPVVARLGVHGWGSYRIDAFCEVEDAAAKTARVVRLKRPGIHPFTRDMVDPITSPSGDRLAWLFECKREPRHLPDWLLRLLPFLRRDGKTMETAEIWVSDVDGTDMRKLGWVGASQQEGMGRLLEWSPDGRAVRFYLKGDLYEVDAH
jgi:hypothetical protein